MNQEQATKLRALTIYIKALAESGDGSVDFKSWETCAWGNAINLFDIPVTWSNSCALMDGQLIVEQHEDDEGNNDMGSYTFMPCDDLATIDNACYYFGIRTSDGAELWNNTRYDELTTIGACELFTIIANGIIEEEGF